MKQPLYFFLTFLIICLLWGCSHSRYHHLPRSTSKTITTNRHLVLSEAETSPADSLNLTFKPKVEDSSNTNPVLNKKEKIKFKLSNPVKLKLPKFKMAGVSDSTQVDIVHQTSKAERFALLGFKFAMASLILLAMALLCAVFIEIDALGIALFFLSRLLNLTSIWLEFLAFLKKQAYSIKLKNRKYLIMGVILNLLMYLVIIGIFFSVFG